jgi:phospholipase/carboxylesterase
LISIGSASIGAVVASSCANLVEESFGMVRTRVRRPGGETAQEARLLARPTQPSGASPPGLQPLGLAGGRDGLLYVPAGHRSDRPAPLVVSLHGAGGNAHGGLSPLQSFADEVGLILLSPASRGRTWDSLLDDYGPDIDYIDRALAWTFRRYAVDPARLAVGGFSDGASYALSIGLTNGDLFTHVLAFSPGFAAPAARRGAPRPYISHGTQDDVLPIDACSRRIVPMLRRDGYDVRYHEFEGPHTVPPEIAREALDWFLAG